MVQWVCGRLQQVSGERGREGGMAEGVVTSLAQGPNYHNVYRGGSQARDRDLTLASLSWNASPRFN